MARLRSLIRPNLIGYNYQTPSCDYTRNFPLSFSFIWSLSHSDGTNLVVETSENTVNIRSGKSVHCLHSHVPHALVDTQQGSRRHLNHSNAYLQQFAGGIKSFVIDVIIEIFVKQCIQ